jgi:hypothetical protein
MQVLTQSIPDDVHPLAAGQPGQPQDRVSDYRHRYGEFFTQMSTWLEEGKVKFREDIVDGLEHAKQAFISLLEGKRFGNLVIRVANDKPARTHGRQE